MQLTFDLSRDRGNQSTDRGSGANGVRGGDVIHLAKFIQGTSGTEAGPAPLMMALVMELSWTSSCSPSNSASRIAIE